MIRQVYRAAADRCAALVADVPALEAPFVGLGALVWTRPRLGRFYRSTVDRLAVRLRTRGEPYRRCDVFGQSLMFDVTEFTTKALYFGRVAYEPQTTSQLIRLLKPGSVFVDVGANHGYFSVLAATLVGGEGRVVAFEPNPAVFEQLQAHVKMNGLGGRVTAVEAALSDTSDGRVALFVSQSTLNSGLSSLTPTAMAIDLGLLSLDHAVTVRVDTFDHWFAASGLARIDLVKLDVEGAEHRVVTGMSAALASGTIDALVCETQWDGPTHRVLCDAGFDPTRLESMPDVCNILYTRNAGSRA